MLSLVVSLSTREENSVVVTEHPVKEEEIPSIEVVPIQVTVFNSLSFNFVFVVISSMITNKNFTSVRDVPDVVVIQVVPTSRIEMLSIVHN